MTEFQEAQEGFRGALTRAHDDAVRLAYEAGRKHGEAAGAKTERELCARIAAVYDQGIANTIREVRQRENPL